MKKQTTSESSKSAILMDNSTKRKSSKYEVEAEAKRARAHSSKLPTDNFSVELQLSLIHEGETFLAKITLAGEKSSSREGVRIQLIPLAKRKQLRNLKFLRSYKKHKRPTYLLLKEKLKDMNLESKQRSSPTLLKMRKDCKGF